MILEKGADGRLKRIEYRGRNLRASRTGGVALRAQTRAAGINLTANTARGTRVSTRLAKGTQGAFQNGRFVLRGRYGEGPTKLNLSKSGVSVSTKTEIGTFNWFKPRYSSVKIGGVQVRGKNAIYLHLILGLIQLVGYLLLFIAQATIVILQALYWLGIKTYLGSKRLIQNYQERQMRPVEENWQRQLNKLDRGQLVQLLDSVFLDLARGRTLDVRTEKKENEFEKKAYLALLLDGVPLKLTPSLELLFGCLAAAFEKQAGPDRCLEQFFAMDDQAVTSGGRNKLQEKLLASYANACGIEAEKILFVD